MKGENQLEVNVNLSSLEQDWVVKGLWKEFADVPVNPETECIEEEFLYFEKGAHREVIWKWFDGAYSKGVEALLYDWLEEN